MNNIKEMIQLQLQGSPEDIKAAKLAINTALNILNPDERPGFKWNWDECGYTDSVGGHHDAGVGWMPDGHYCGECTHSTCEVCSVWKGKMARQELGGIPAYRLKAVS